MSFGSFGDGRGYDGAIMNLAIASIVGFTAAGTLALSSLRSPDRTQDELQFPAASPPGKVEQRIGVTDVEITYARPSARGREIFGGLVPYDAVWRTGANDATRITFSDDVVFGGEDVPAGTYGLFTIPGREQWTVILNEGAEQWGSYGYDQKLDAARVTVTPTKLADTVETFTIGIGDLGSGKGTIFLDWANTRVSIAIDTKVAETLAPKIEAAMAADGGDKPYLAAAMFYFENELNLQKAATWIAEGAKAQPNAFWITYRQGLILEKLGDKEGALAAANKSLEMASKANGEIKDEYMRLNKALISRLK